MLTVEGIEVYPGEYLGNKNVTFEYLTEEGQKRLFQENKDLFAVNAIFSRYEEVRNMAENSKDEYSSETVNEILREFLPFQDEYYDKILGFLKSKQLRLDNDNREMLKNSVYWKFQFFASMI